MPEISKCGLQPRAPKQVRRLDVLCELQDIAEKDVQKNRETRRSRLMRFVMRSLRHIGMTIFFMATSAACLWSQTGATGRGIAATVGPLFGALNASLEQTADGVLTSAAQANITADSGPPHARPTGSAIRYGDELRSSPAGSAFARIALLGPVLDPILSKFGIPTELTAVVLVESGGDPMALSPKGARGIWQLMPKTARRYGLIVNKVEDDRVDVEKSTRAATHYLSDLYSEFGSWPLALAAYNTGEHNLQSAIERSRSTDFVVLSSLGLLPLETRNYVPAVLAAGTRLTNSPPAEQLPLQWKRNTHTVFAVAESSN